MPAHVLIVEDKAPNLELMTYLLEAFGYVVTTASDGNEGIEAARARHPDIVVCDIQLPTVNGYEVAQQIKGDSATKDIPIIAVTALAMVGDRDKALSAGFDGYISKPITPELFVEQVEKYLKPYQRSRVSPEAQEPARATTQESPQSHRATILTVDDISVNIMLLRSILEPCGYKIVSASSLAEALRACQEQRPDLIISDIHLSGGTGYDLLRFVKSENGLAEKPFLFLSATADRKDQQRARELGAVKLLGRPIEPQVLLAEIAAALASRGPE